jgi:hypothetical protein
MRLGHWWAAGVGLLLAEAASAADPNLLFAQSLHGSGFF